MQYGGLRSSATCVTTSCSNDSFASPTHITNQSLDKGLWGVAPMPAKEEHGCDSGSESIDKREPRDILHCHVERRYQRSLLQKGQNDRIKKIVSIFYGIQCSLNNFELSASIMTNASPYHNTSVP
jgi:hypothetical protein